MSGLDRPPSPPDCRRLPSPAVGLIVAVWWWAIPGTPIPILHSFTGGWQPFVMAYPWCLHQFLDAD